MILIIHTNNTHTNDTTTNNNDNDDNDNKHNKTLIMHNNISNTFHTAVEASRLRRGHGGGGAERCVDAARPAGGRDAIINYYYCYYSYNNNDNTINNDDNTIHKQNNHVTIKPW